LLQGNGQPHTAQRATSESVQGSGTSVDITSCNSDFNLCDFWSFPTLKRELQGQILKSDGQATRAAVANVRKISENVSEVGRKLQKCDPCEGRYVKKGKYAKPSDCLKYRRVKVVSFVTKRHS